MIGIDIVSVFSGVGMVICANQLCRWFFFQNQSNPQKILKRFFLSEALKLFVITLFFSLVFQVSSLNAALILISFSITQILYSFVALRIE